MTTNEAPRTFAEWWMTPEGAFDHSHEKAALAAWNAAIASLPSGDYAGLVERLQDNRRAGYEQDADCVEAADAIKALERKKVELAQLLLKAIKSDLKAESDLAACLGQLKEFQGKS